MALTGRDADDNYAQEDGDNCLKRLSPDQIVLPRLSDQEQEKKTEQK